MKDALVPLLGATIIIGAGACGGAPGVEDPGGEGTVTIAGKTFRVNRVQLSYQKGDDGYFRVEGDDAERPEWAGHEHQVSRISHGF